MKKILSALFIIINLASCSSITDVTPSAYFKVNEIKVSNPTLTYSTISSTNCTSQGSIKMTGTDANGKPVELNFVNLTTLEGTNTSKKLISGKCNTWGYFRLGTGTTGDFYFDIPENTQFEYNKSTNSLKLGKITIVSISTFNAVGLEINGSF